MDFHAIIEIPKGRKHAHPRFADLPDIETFAKSAMDRKVVCAVPDLCRQRQPVYPYSRYA